MVTGGGRMVMLLKAQINEAGSDRRAHGRDGIASKRTTAPRQSVPRHMNYT